MARKLYHSSRRIFFVLWLAAYRLYVFPGDLFYFLYYRFLDKFWPCFDFCWEIRKTQQGKRIKEMRRRVLNR